jgi:hypothetical protein
MKVLSSPWVESFERFLAQVSASLVISSPFVGREPCQTLASILTRRVDASRLQLLVVTNLSRENMLNGSTDPRALLHIMDEFPRATIRFIPSLHAKVYVADHNAAIVTSANLTRSGLCRNLELGLWLDDRPLVEEIRNQVQTYGSLGTAVLRQQLETFASIVDDLQDLQRRVTSSGNARLRAEFSRRLEGADVEVLRARAGGRTPHAIFADAIVYVLQKGPRTTPELHQEIQSVHPDLCDDTVDRVIDGKRFGKKWKHAVRTAQQHLKKSGTIRTENGVWRLTRRR